MNVNVPIYDLNAETTVEKILSSLHLQDHVRSNWERLSEKIVKIYDQNKESADDIQFQSLIRGLQYEINNMVLDCSLVLPSKLSKVMDKIIKKNHLQQNDRAKAATAIFMAIVFYVVLTAAKNEKLQKETTNSVIDLIEKYIPFSQLVFA